MQRGQARSPHTQFLRNPYSFYLVALLQVIRDISVWLEEECEDQDKKALSAGHRRDTSLLFNFIILELSSSSSSFLFLKKYIFLFWPQGLRDLSFLTRDRTTPSSLEMWSLNHWT